MNTIHIYFKDTEKNLDALKAMVENSSRRTLNCFVQFCLMSLILKTVCDDEHLIMYKAVQN